MSILEGKRLYLSGPIEHGDNSENWRTEPINVLKTMFKLDVFNPFADPKQQWAPELYKARENKDYEKMQFIAKKFVRKDLSLVDRSDFLIAYLPYKVASAGMHHEITVAHNSKKPVLLVCPQTRAFIPFWYYGFISLDFMFDSWTHLYQYLTEINEGKHKENDKWAFVYGLI